jgi:hypothetical protein
MAFGFVPEVGDRIGLILSPLLASFFPPMSRRSFCSPCIRWCRSPAGRPGAVHSGHESRSSRAVLFEESDEIVEIGDVSSPHVTGSGDAETGAVPVLKID